MTHHLRMFVVDDNGNSKLRVIDHKPIDPANDEPGDPFDQPTGTVVKFISKRDGDLTIEFKVEVAAALVERYRAAANSNRRPGLEGPLCPCLQPRSPIRRPP